MVDQLHQSRSETLRQIFVIGGDAGSTWIKRIEAADPEAMVFWLNAPLPVPATESITLIGDNGNRDTLLSRLTAMAKRGGSIVYVDMLMRSARDIIDLLRSEGIEIHPIRGRLPAGNANEG